MSNLLPPGCTVWDVRVAHSARSLNREQGSIFLKALEDLGPINPVIL